MHQIDKEQKDFFKQTFNRNDASLYEFDMVLNCDSIKYPEWAAEIVARAYKETFDSEISENNENKK